MVNKKQKLWTHYEQIKIIIETYIALFFSAIFVTLCFSLLAHQRDIDSGVQDAIKIAILSGLKWYAIIMPIITVLFVIWFVCYSGRVEFTENAILCYRFIFSKKTREVLYNDITECVFNDGLWKHRGKYKHGRKIIIYNKGKIILEFELYYKLCFLLLTILDKAEVRVISDNRNLQTIDKHYNTDFNALSAEQQIMVLKHYCKMMKSDKRDIKKILKIKQ